MRIAHLVLVAALAAAACTEPEARDASPPSRSPPSSTEAPTSDAGRSPATTSPNPAPTAPPAATAPITIAFSGDILPHGPLNEKAAAYGAPAGAPYDFRPMLAPMAPIVGEADLALCHMEVPVAPTPERIGGYPVFGAPTQLVEAIRDAGYDGCSTASNHSLDQGPDGVRATLDVFDLYGLGHVGTARSAEEGALPARYERRGVAIAHLSYAYGFNGFTVPPDAPWSVDAIDPARVRDDAQRARRAGADLVIVSLHWGSEYRAQPDEYQERVADELLPSPDIDLVIGHHAHVVQPIREIDATYVVFGLGNELSNQTQTPRRDGLTVVATATTQADGRWRFTGIELVPTWVDLATLRVLPVVPALSDPTTPPDLGRELAESYDRTVFTVATGQATGVAVAPRPTPSSPPRPATRPQVHHPQSWAVGSRSTFSTPASAAGASGGPVGGVTPAGRRTVSAAGRIR